MLVVLSTISKSILYVKMVLFSLILSIVTVYGICAVGTHIPYIKYGFE